MSRRARIWLIVILVIILCVGWFTYKQWNSISAVIDSFKYSQEDVIQKLEENKNSVQEFIDKNEDITVRDLTEEEAKALNEGSLTEEEVISILTGQKNEDKVTSEKPVVDNPKEPKPNEKEPKKTSNQVVAEAIAKLYIQKNNYLSKLDNIEAHVRQLYIDMSKEEKKGAKQRLLTEYLPQVASWESECDSVVYGILDEIKVALKASGQDEAIVTKLEEAYLNEKKLKKSYFINRYMD